MKRNNITNNLLVTDLLMYRWLQIFKMQLTSYIQIVGMENRVYQTRLRSSLYNLHRCHLQTHNIIAKF